MKAHYLEGTAGSPERHYSMNGRNTSTALESLVPVAIREMQEGLADGEAVNRIAETLQHPLKKFMELQGWGLEDPERTASEALTAILVSLDSFKPEEGTFMQWVWGFARNHLRAALRRQRESQSENQQPTQYDTRHQQRHHLSAVDQEERAQLLGTLLGLPEEDYQLLYLSFIEKKNATQIAAELGLSAENVRKKKQKLLAHLHAALPQALPLIPLSD
jgi:RNA polymerase sigma-70 factor (ECF subfamily)